ncbi:MAG: Ig-like domain-containing protein, partial [Gemmatimonadetes bacterium]|nr:Ig-like domain-containing protein [Gemmatimonadota bacterium]
MPVASIFAYACGESTSPVEQVPASITLIPSTVTLNALGETQALTATVRDALGNVVDSAVTFQSSDQSVFTVDADGVVTAVGIGTGRATASVGSLSRSSDVMVSQVGTEISRASGDEQTAAVATTLAAPIVVRIQDALDNGVAGLTVTFSVTGGGGTVSLDSVTTGTDGTASTEWTLGTTAGAVHRLIAAVGGVGRTEFTAVGLPDVPESAAITAGNNQVQPIGRILPVALTVTVADRFGNGVAGQDVTFAVTSGCGEVTPASAPTDSLGEVRAQWTLGTELGAQTVDANVPGITQNPLSFFAEGTNLTVSGVSPDTLVEGQVARVTGTGFDTTTADIAIAVDGASSQITAATESTIDFVVPRTPCRPARDVAVVVTTTNGGTATAQTKPLAPVSFVTLSVGEQTIVQTPADFCFQFAAEANDEEYLLGVQSAASGAELTVATVRGEVIGGATASPSAWTSLRAAAPVTGPAYVADRVRLERWRLHREAEVMLRAAQREALAAAAGAPAGVRASSAGIPRDVLVGDAVALKIPDITGNICSDFFTVSGTVRAVGTRGIWVVDGSNPGGGLEGADFDSLSGLFDDVIYEAATNEFGAPTDLDDNDRIVILISKRINEANQFVLGFVSLTDMLTPDRCESSNQAEIYYAKAPDPGAVTGAVYTREAALKDAPPLIAHEFTHIIQAGHRLFINETQFMSLFMAEGQATLAEEVVGHAALGNTPGQNYGFTIALNFGDRAPNDWYELPFRDLARYFGNNQASPSNPIDGAPHECGWQIREPFPCEGSSRALWYGVTWSLLRWINDQFGPGFAGGAPGIQQALIDNSRVGMPNIANVLGLSTDSLLAQWSAMLYLDGRVSGLPARLTFPSWDLVSIFGPGGFGTTHSSAQLQPTLIVFSDFLQRVEVRDASTAYFLLGGGNRPATAVRVTDGTDEELAAHMQ